MRLKYLLLVFFLFGMFELMAQCPISTLTIDNQKEIDNFSTTYPNCEELTKALVITGSVSNLDGLSAIKKYNSFTVYNTYQLLTINGSPNIETVNGLYLFSNTALLAIKGFDGVINIKNDLLIESNPNLTEIHAFNNLNYLDNSIKIVENFDLQSIIGFDSLKQIGNSLNIINNPSLSQMNAFGNLQQNLGRMIFRNIQTDPMPNLKKLDFTPYLVLDQINTQEINLSKKDIFYNPKFLFDTLLITNCQIKKIIGQSNTEGLVNFRFSYVEITNNPLLDSINALFGIRFGLRVENNPNLKTIKDFAYHFVNLGNPDPEYKYIIIRNNNSLNDISKFHFNPRVLDRLEIVDNPGLSAAVFVKNIVSVKNAIISNNAQLDSLFFRTNGFDIDGTLTIDNNTNLIFIDIKGLKNGTFSTLNISNNKSLKTIQFTQDTIVKFNTLSVVNNVILPPIEIEVNVINNLTLQNNGQWDSINGFNIAKHISNLTIKDNKQLKAISGFKQLETVYNLSIELNPKLQTIAGFKNVNKIREGGLNIINNDQLLNLYELEELTKLSGQFFVSSNEQLESMFKKEKQIEYISGKVTILENDNLTTLSGLEGVDLDLIQTRISNNTKLSYCNYPNICRALSLNANIIIDDNDENCRDNNEVLGICKNNLNYPVYPNPAFNVLYFNTISKDVQLNITVYDMYGRIVNYFEQTVPSIDISALANGSYLVQVASDQLNFKQKFIKY